jgi:hypothetical protein
MIVLALNALAHVPVGTKAKSPISAYPSENIENEFDALASPTEDFSKSCKKSYKVNGAC